MLRMDNQQLQAAFQNVVYGVSNTRPVLSIATCVHPDGFSHSDIACNSAVVVPYCRSGFSLPGRSRQATIIFL